MALHVCRDFLSWGNPLNQWGPYYGNYLLAIFLRGVLGYVVVGHTNFNLDGITYTKGTGNNGSLNQGGTDIYAFAPNGYTVSAADIGRIVVLRSPGYPMVNSGLFRVTSVDTTNNWLYLNYRSGDVPPAETGMTWTVFENEFVFTANVNNGGNGIANTYQTQGTATASRIILQSPSSLNWQVRICVESNYDQVFNGGAVTPSANGGAVTIAPGFGGTLAGDFAVGGPHLHQVLYYNTHDQSIAGATVGFWPDNVVQGRFYMWGDDVTGTCFAACRSVIGGNGAGSFTHFGLTVNEEQPLPPKPVQRLFVMGANGSGNSGDNGIYWASGPGTARAGLSFGLSGQPITAIYSVYNPLAGEVFAPGNTSARNSTNGGDNPYIAASELIPVDIFVGGNDHMSSDFNSNEHMILEGRRLGTAPFVQMGRGNYGYFQVSTDSTHAWLHLTDGMYLPWQGSILP